MRKEKDTSLVGSWESSLVGKKGDTILAERIRETSPIEEGETNLMGRDRDK